MNHEMKSFYMLDELNRLEHQDRYNKLLAIIHNRVDNELAMLQAENLHLLADNQIEVMTTNRIYEKLKVSRLKRILEHYEIDIVIDVGANRGQFGTELRQINYTGKIISFEPILSAYNKISQIAKADSNWEVHRIALGEQNETKNINVSEWSEFTSFLKSNTWCENQFGQNSIGNHSEEVTVRRLDEIFEENNINPKTSRIFLKIDTQGYDLNVFKGLGKLSEHIIGLQTELSSIPIYENMPHMTECISFYEKSGFKMAGIFPLAHEESTLCTIEFDCIMINGKLKI